MTDLFKQTDTFRLSVETQAAKVDAAKAHLVQESENALINKLYEIYGNGTLTGNTTSDLKEVEAPTSESVAFDGTISVSAYVVDSGKKLIAIPVSVTANQLDFVSDAELKQMISEITAEETHTEFPSIEAPALEASLSDFSLMDDGSDYLKVFHPSLDTGKELGVISKDEYTKSSDKQALLTSVLSNSMKNTGLEAEHDLKFVGSFVEPSINVEAKEAEAPLFTEEIAEENIVEATEDTVYLSHQADSYRQAVESEEQVHKAAFEKVASSAANSLVSYLQGLNYGGVKVLSTDISNESFVSITASLFDTVGEKVVTFSLPVRDSLYTLPHKEAVHKLISETVDLKTQISSEFEKETLEHLQAIDELETYNKVTTEAAFAEERIEKTAADAGGMQYCGPVDVLHIDKHTLGLPDDTEIGEKAYVDGFWWQLTNKDHNNLGKEAESGSIWTFTKVAPEKGEPDVKL